MELRVRFLESYDHLHFMLAKQSEALVALEGATASERVRSTGPHWLSGQRSDKPVLFCSIAYENRYATHRE